LIDLNEKNNVFIKNESKLYILNEYTVIKLQYVYNLSNIKSNDDNLMSYKVNNSLTNVGHKNIWK
jgi:hypothetical protein